MQALLLTAKQSPLVWKTVPTPVLRPGEALVAVSHAAYNHRDWWISQGQYGKVDYPCILGSDISGQVSAVFDKAAEVWLGQRIIVNPSLNWGDQPRGQDKDFNILGMPTEGGLAEYVRVPVTNLAQAPAHLSDAQAAALPLAGLTAYRALFSRARLEPGERLLITGIGGGAALFALQFGLAAGCEVHVTSSSQAKIAAAIALGARGGVSYKEDGWADRLVQQAGGQFDVILDSAGGEGIKDLIEVACTGGRIVFFGGTAGPWPQMPPQRLFWKQLSLLGTTMGSPADWEAMLAFVNLHKLVPIIDQIIPRDQAQHGLERMGQGSQFGKVVVQIT